MYIFVDTYLHVCVYTCIYDMHICMNVCMHECLSAYTYVRYVDREYMCVAMHIYTCIYICNGPFTNYVRSGGWERDDCVQGGWNLPKSFGKKCVRLRTRGRGANVTTADNAGCSRIGEKFIRNLWMIGRGVCMHACMDVWVYVCMHIFTGYTFNITNFGKFFSGGPKIWARQRIAIVILV